ncbi:MAG: glycosyltransferase family 2 protein [bacterium]
MFSIIIATYNCGPKLEATIESVLSQKADLFELIIIDGGSTDSTLELLKKYEHRLRYVSEKDNGVYEALNKGIEMASGKYLYFLGGGDLLRKEILEQLKVSLPLDERSFVYGMVCLRQTGEHYLRGFSLSDFRTRNICHQAIFYERNIFSRIGKFELEYRVYADWVLNLKCFVDESIQKIFIDQVIADYEGGGMSETQEDSNFRKAFPLLIKQHLGVGQYLLHKVDVIKTYLYLTLRQAVPPGLRPSLSHARRRLVSRADRKKDWAH